MANQIRTRDVAPYALRRIDTHALFPEEDRGVNHVLRNDLVFNDLLVVINVVDELIQDVDTLLEAAFNPFPFVRTNDARDQVEGKRALRAGGIAVHIERNPQLDQQTLRRLLAALELAFFKLLQRFQQEASLRPRGTVRVEYFVVKTVVLVGTQVHRVSRRGSN